jgi:hypothetical protein
MSQVGCAPISANTTGPNCAHQSRLPSGRPESAISAAPPLVKVRQKIDA